MDKYSALIQLIPEVKSLMENSDSDTQTISQILHEIFEYSQSHLEEKLLSTYREQFKNLGLDHYKNRNDIPVETLDGHTIMVLLTFLFRQDHFCNGTFETYIKSGLILRCLDRLQKISESI